MNTYASGERKELRVHQRKMEGIYRPWRVRTDHVCTCLTGHAGTLVDDTRLGRA